MPENPTPMALDEASGSVAENRTKDAGPIILTHVGKALRKNEQVQIKTMTTHALSVVSKNGFARSFSHFSNYSFVIFFHYILWLFTI